MTPRRALAALALLTLAYLLALLWVDSRNQVFRALPSLLSALPLLMALSLLSYLMRYLRWHWLMRRSGHRLPPVTGALAYLSGFAFTATPGKAGELARIRYHTPLGVPAKEVFSAFLYERSFDLVCVLLLGSLAARQPAVLAIPLIFVALFLGAVWWLVFHPGSLQTIAQRLEAHAHPRWARFLHGTAQGFAGCRHWLTPLDVLLSLALGLGAWTLTAMAFVLLLAPLGIHLAWQSALPVYPLAMLIGAASMLPGGLGSTELAIVALLSQLGVNVEASTLAALGIRFATLWFAVACGLLALALLEMRAQRHRPASPTTS